MAPPVPIPNTEVKRCSPDDSTSIGCAKVGRRQSYAPFLAKAGNGALVFHGTSPFAGKRRRGLSAAFGQLSSTAPSKLGGLRLGQVDRLRARRWRGRIAATVRVPFADASRAPVFDEMHLLPGFFVLCAGFGADVLQQRPN